MTDLRPPLSSRTPVQNSLTLNEKFMNGGNGRPIVRARQPITGYMLFWRKEKFTIIQQHPDTPAHELSKIFAIAWDCLDENTRNYYNTQARAINAKVGLSPDAVKENDEMRAAENTRLMKIINDIRSESAKNPQQTQVVRNAPKATPALTNAKLESLGASLRMSANQNPPAFRQPPHHHIIRPAISQAQAMEMYYLSLCQPAFPHVGESPLTPVPPSFYYDQYMHVTRLLEAGMR